VQIVIAGKSHPADDEGKRLIQKLVRFTQDPELRRRIVFLPNYDIAMALVLYPGCDVWLNNPLRPLEACGTSGMKAALNGALNLSILDGWWNEYYDGEDGWAIPSADSAGDAAERDKLEAESLYDLIENQIAPRFYRRDDKGVPGRWMRSVRHTLATLSPELSADRMVREYVQRLYVPAAAAAVAISDGDFAGGRELASWKSIVSNSWAGVSVVHVESGGLAPVPQVGDALQVRAQVQLGSLTPDDVAVQVVYGTSREGDELEHISTVELAPLEDDVLDPLSPMTGTIYLDGSTTFAGTVTLERPGAFGYNVRVVPKSRYLASPAEMGLVAVAH
jgi:starch phosphorylase